ncbi:hypothetical protein K2X92_02185 [Candidatus Gracilibacteria bacterium]|nr:hypothetical protein [Candidatus Gracilibacteria bacterium]
MQTLTHDSESQEVTQTKNIHDFRELFGADENIDDTIIARQQEVFGFSLFLLHSKSVYDALKFGFLNSRNTFEKTKSILSIPHTYIFGGLFLGMLLMSVGLTGLFLPIFIGLVLFSIFPIFQIIRSKVELYKQSRIFFNIDIASADTIRQEFLQLTPFKHKEMLWNKSGGGTVDGNSAIGKLGFYLFSQPFIFGHLHLFAGIPFFDLIIFDILIGCILFGIFEKFIFLAFVMYYTIYFYLFDKFPRFFSREDQERDLYMDIYRSGNKLIESINSLEKDTNLMFEGTISPTLSENFGSTMEQIGSLHTLIENNAHLLEGKEKFQQFLVNMINEIITMYVNVFDRLASKINAIESEFNESEISEEQRNYLINIIKPILTNRKQQLESVKTKILEKRMVLTNK